MHTAIRTATMHDGGALRTLIERSARELCAPDYCEATIARALTGAFGVDSQLIRDRTYFVIEDPAGLVACGGWSARRTLFGGDARAERDETLLDPARDAARIRAFFVDPRAARRGLGRALLGHCEAAAAARGFTRFTLMATLPGVRLYSACGYVAGAPIDHALAPGITIRFVPMHKPDPAAARPAP